MHLFNNWLVDVAKQDMEYCQALIAYDSTNASSWCSKSGHVLMVSMTAQSTFKMQFQAWEADLQRMFSLNIAMMRLLPTICQPSLSSASHQPLSSLNNPLPQPPQCLIPKDAPRQEIRYLFNPT